MTTAVERSDTHVDIENIIVVTHGASKDMLISYTSIMRQYSGLQPLVMKHELSKQAQVEAERLSKRGHTRNSVHIGSINKTRHKYSDRRMLNVLRKILVISPILHNKRDRFPCVLDHRFSSFGIYVSESPVTRKPVAVQIFSRN